MGDSLKQLWPATMRNREPILEVLRRVLPAEGSLLELASGSGEHAAYFARRLPNWRWQASDVDAENLASVRAWGEEAALPNLPLALELDVLWEDWGAEQVDAIFCANMIHIAPWECALGMLAGAGRQLRPGGLLMIYGAFRIGGSHTAPSNEAFDQRLRQRDARWGVRDLEAVDEVGAQHGIHRIDRVEMPANNQFLVFQRAV